MKAPKKMMMKKTSTAKKMAAAPMPPDNDADDAPMGYKRGGMVGKKKK